MENLPGFIKSAFEILAPALAFFTAFFAYRDSRNKKVISNFNSTINELRTGESTQQARITQLQTVNTNLGVDITKKDKEISELVKFVKNCYQEENLVTNVIIVGPRAAGKSSLVSAWIKHWKDIKKLTPTASYDKYLYKYSGFKEITDGVKYNDTIKYTKRIHAAAEIWDYGGEDHLRNDALGSGPIK